MNLAVGGPPALALEIDDVRTQRQVLHHEAGVALEARAGPLGGQPDLALLITTTSSVCSHAGDAPGVNPQPAPDRSPAPCRSACYDVRPTGFSSRWAATVLSSAATLFQKLQNQVLQLGRRRTVNILRRRDAHKESDSPPSESELEVART
jgi:hypothetical protein